MNRRALGIGAAVLVLAGAAAGTAFWVLRAPEPRTLVLAVGWNGADLQALDRVLARFHSLYPRLTVRTAGAGEAGRADLVVSSGFTAEERRALLADPVPWTGGLWVLAARREILDAAAGTLPAEAAALRAGRATPAMFRRLLETVAASGKVPLTVGNSHRWPFLVWLEHWGAATLGPGAVDPMPASFEALVPAYDELMRWKAKGWFEPSVWGSGWAQGLRPLDEGTAAFALVSEGNLGTLGPGTWEKLEFLAFPRSEGAEPWSVGSVTFLGITAPPEAGDDARLLVRFLTSPGVTQELAALTGKPFFAWDSGAAVRVLPSWADAAMTAPYNALAARFDPH